MGCVSVCECECEGEFECECEENTRASSKGVMGGWDEGPKREESQVDVCA